MTDSLRILVVEPWHGGSHEAFLHGWLSRSDHRIEVLGLPARHWKWRMEGAALTLAERAAGLEPPDVLVASDYLDLARFRGFLPPTWAGVPALAYFHENQLTYPGAEPDSHFGFTNIATLLNADLSVFNSRFHLEDFGRAATELLERLPKPRPRAALAAALDRAQVVWPGIEWDSIPLGPGRPEGAPIRVGWCHRWEEDKDPAAFCRAIHEATYAGARLELVILGEGQERELPDGLVVHQGFAASRDEYLRLLGECDVIVSTARHEFYGIGMLEGAACGAALLAPRRLAYPETLVGGLAAGLYDDGLARHLVRFERGDREAHRAAARAHDASRTRSALDDLVQALKR